MADNVTHVSNTQELSTDWYRDDTDRRRPSVRMQALRLLTDLSDSLDIAAAEVAQELEPHDWNNPIVQDQARDIVLWQVIEYLSQAFYPREFHDECFQQNVKAHQLTAAHVAHWFGIELDMSGRETVAADETWTPRKGWMVNRSKASQDAK